MKRIKIKSKFQMQPFWAGCGGDAVGTELRIWRPF